MKKEAAKSLPRLAIDNQVNGFNPSKIHFKKAFIVTEQQLNTQLNVSLVLLPINSMFNMNNQLRSKPSPTDVLSLPLDPNAGEVFICPEFIYDQKYDDSRILHLWVHGLLHIAGHTHDNDDDFKIMSTHEIKILSQLGIEDPYAE